MNTRASLDVPAAKEGTAGLAEQGSMGQDSTKQKTTDTWPNWGFMGGVKAVVLLSFWSKGKKTRAVREKKKERAKIRSNYGWWGGHSRNA